MQIISQMKLIESGNSIHICRDSDDDKFLSCADAGSCMYVVSGDNYLPTLKKYKDITILAVAQFFAMYDNSEFL